MAADAGFNFNDMSIRMGMNQRKGGGEGDGANEKDIFDFLFDTIGAQIFDKSTKLTGVPHLEGLLSTGITRPFEMQGVHEKMINPMAQSFSAPGGFLYRMFSALMKNSAITDHTQGIESGPQIAGSGDYGGDTGGGSGGGGGGNYGESSMADMSGHYSGANIEPLMVEYGGRTYQVANMSAESLGNITPSAGADVSSIQRGDIEIG